MQEQQTAPQRPTMAVVNPIIRLHEADNVVMARATLLPGTAVGDGINATQRIPPGPGPQITSEAAESYIRGKDVR